MRSNEVLGGLHLYTGKKGSDGGKCVCVCVEGGEGLGSPCVEHDRGGQA